MNPIEAERDFLLKSLRDLDVEFEAGNIDETDYETLKADYTVRAADAIRALGAAEGPKPQRVAAKRSAKKVVALSLGVLLFAVGAGYLMAQASGERGADDALTGNIDESIRDRVLTCEQFGFSGETLQALECFDEVLAEDPKNAEALTYRGWFVALAANNAANTGETDAAVELFGSAQASLTAAIEIEPSYPDARALRGVMYKWIGQSDLACADFAVLDTLDTPDMIIGLTSSARAELACP